VTDQLTTPVRTLALCCPDLLDASLDEATTVRAFESVVQAIETLTPRIELTGLGTLLFATRGPTRYWGGEAILAERAQTLATAALARAALATAALERGRQPGPGSIQATARVGIADGPFAALLAARVAAEEDVLVIPPGATPSFLARFPVAVLERAELTDVLVRLGLRTLGDFAALRPADVLGRFGADGRIAQLLAAGLEARPPAPRRLPPDLVATAELDPPAEVVAPVAFAARRLATELHERLAALGLACTRVAIEAETEHGEQHSRLWRHEGALTAAMVAERARWQIDGWLLGDAAHRPSAGITVLRLVPDQVVPATGRQLGFWGGTSREGERAARALARVQGLLGPDAVCLPERRGGRQPNEQIALIPLGAVDAEHHRADGNTQRVVAPWPGGLPTPSPAMLHDPPVPTEVRDAGGVVVRVSGRGALSGAPHELLVRDRWMRVASWTGPWLLDERWWDAPRHRRQARFQIVVEPGVAHLVLLEQGRWWLTATYD
jgi:protein ImuB